ncbi:MAG: hypothetical protein AAFR54_07185 [Planctomycetota bacterium]
MAGRIALAFVLAAAAGGLGWFALGGAEDAEPDVARAVPEATDEERDAGPLDAVEATAVAEPEARKPVVDDTPPPAPAPVRPAAAAPPAPAAVDVDPAPEEDVVELPSTATISGVLESESGSFAADFDALRAGVHIDLVRTSDRETAFASPTLEPVLGSDGTLREVRFRFEGLAADEYEVTLSTLDHVRWEPSSIRTPAPGTGLRFLAFEEDRSVPLALEVVDAETGEALPDGAWSAFEVRATVSDENGVLLHSGPLDASRMSLAAEVDLAIVADGYATAFFDERSLQLDGASLSARVALERGFACRLVVLGKGRGRVLASGARVELDGRSAGRTDDAGALLVSAAERPERIAVTWRGQRLEGAFDEVLLSRRPSLRIALLE